MHSTPFPNTLQAKTYIGRDGPSFLYGNKFRKIGSVPIYRRTFDRLARIYEEYHGWGHTEKDVRFGSYGARNGIHRSGRHICDQPTRSNVHRDHLPQCRNRHHSIGITPPTRYAADPAIADTARLLSRSLLSPFIPVVYNIFKKNPDFGQKKSS